jgi:hypothetical protein
MPHASEGRDGDDDLARQRRKREARLLDQQLVDSPELTLADVVADVLAASDTDPGTLDVRGYLAAEGHHWRTIEAVVAYLHRHYVPIPGAGPGIQPTQLPQL